MLQRPAPRSTQKGCHESHSNQAFLILNQELLPSVDPDPKTNLCGNQRFSRQRYAGQKRQHPELTRRRVEQGW